MIGIDKALWHGMHFILKSLADSIHAEMSGVTSLRREILAAQTRFEAGELSLEELGALEAHYLQQYSTSRQDAGPIRGAQVQVELFKPEHSTCRGKKRGSREVGDG